MFSIVYFLDVSQSGYTLLNPSSLIVKVNPEGIVTFCFFHKFYPHPVWLYSNYLELSSTTGPSINSPLPELV